MNAGERTTLNASDGAGRLVAALAGLVMIGTAAFGQADQRAAFVVNDGNTEGSVTSYLIHEDGSLEFVQKLITGEGPGFDYGTNATSLAITPNGKYLAVGHASGDPPPGKPPGRRITVLQINHDATIDIHMDFLTDPTPNSLEWVDDEHLIVMKSNFSEGSEVIVYHVDVDEQFATEIDRQSTGVFSDAMALDPQGEYLYTESTFGEAALRIFRINADRTLTQTYELPITTFVLGLNVTPDGERLYGGGGISGDVVSGFDIDRERETLAELENSPYDSPGDGPRQAVISSDGAFLAAGHGGDATIQVFFIDQRTGDLTFTGTTFDAGFQANLRDMAVHEELLLVPARGILSDDPKGLATFEFMPDGSLKMKSDFVDSQGIDPDAVVGWSPPAPACPEDLTGDGTVGVADLLVLIGGWGDCDDPEDCPADLTGDGSVGVADLLALIGAWGVCPK